jgi:RNA-directed DNA polymerase
MRMAENDKTINHDPNSKSSTLALGIEVHLAHTATDIPKNLAEELMVRIANTANLKQAFKAVKRNKGAPGIDKRTIYEVDKCIDEIIIELSTSPLDNSYMPSAVRGVHIPKSKGETRQLGIPTVIDRIVQQAISQVLSPIFEPYFSNQSYGFRPKRSAQQTIANAKDLVSQGKLWVVDIDIAKFFDNVNHDIIMSKLAKSISDKQLLKLIRKFLKAGMMQDGLYSRKELGMPQGSPLSPLLSNIMLHDLDQELHRRRHSFVRYADDCNIYVASKTAAQRVLTSITKFLNKTEIISQYR